MTKSEFAKGQTIKLADSIEYQAGSIVSKVILNKNTGNITLFAFDKGQSLSKHTAPFDAMVSVIEGKGKIIIDDAEHELHTGDSIIMPANVPHVVEATERFKMVLVMIREQDADH